MSTRTKMKLPDRLKALLAKAKNWYAEDGTEQKLRELRWLKARIQVKDNEQFMDWLDSVALDYFQLSRKASPDHPDRRVYLDGMGEAVATILSKIETATQDQYDINKKNLEDEKKRIAR